MEQEARYFIDRHLENKGWILDKNNPNRNVYVEGAKTPEQRKALGSKRPDYILYKNNTDIPIAVIEAKKSGVDLQPALIQGMQYASCLNAPIVFAMNGAYAETRYVPNDKGLILNGSEVREIIREFEALAFIHGQSNEAYTIPKEVVVSRKELIKIFHGLNETLRAEGLRAGIERFSEFANILFLKLLSENDEKSWWQSILRQNNDDLIGYINDHVIKRIENKYGGNVFMPLMIKNPRTLKRIIDQINPLILSTIDSDIKGDAFEYFLRQTTSTQNDLGEYFTPRHVIKTVVNLVSPKFGEKIYDPFCGTGGFLIESYNYIRENTIIKTEKQKEEMKYKTVFGREITNSSRIAKMNMILHGDGHSGVNQGDSLANPVDGEYDVVVTNIPFSQTTEFGSLYYDGISKNNGDAACVLHALRSLKPGGRMGLIVPEGFLFRKNLRQLREFLLSKVKLQSVISLPSGTFLPYTTQKTSVLYLTDAHKTQSQKWYWYFEVNNDGFTLDNNRKPIKNQNDLQKIESSDIKKAEKDDYYKNNALAIGFEIISIEDIRNNNYELGKTHETDTDTDFIELKDIATIMLGNSAPQDDKYFEKGKYPFFRVSDLAKYHITDCLIETRDKINDMAIKKMKLFPKGTIIFPKSGAATLLNHRGILGCDGYVASHMAGIICDQSKVIPDYLFHVLTDIDAKDIMRNPSYPSIRKEDLEIIKVPLPSLAKQKEIAMNIGAKQKQITELEMKSKKLKREIKNEVAKIFGKKSVENFNEEVNPNHLEDFDNVLKRASPPIKQRRT